jgi:hypothetical protein
MREAHRLPVLRSVLTFLLCAGAGVAQRVWVVDALNRPGTHFPDIQSAVNAAAPGDVVQVRDAGTAVSYAGAAVSRGITLVGQPRAFMSSSISVQSLPAGERCTIASLDLGGFFGSGLTVTGCAGQVHVESVICREVFFTTSAGLQIDASAHVTLTRCSILGLHGVICSSSTVAFTDCFLEGRGYHEALGGPGLVASHSRIALANTTISGASTNSCCLAQRPPQPAVAATKCTMFVTGSRTRLFGGGVLAQPCSCNTTEVGISADAATTFFVGNAQPFTWRGGTHVARVQPSLSPNRNPAAGTLTWTLEGPANAAFATLAGMPGGPAFLSFGDLWLDLTRPNTLLDAGVLGAGPHSHQRTIPGNLPPGSSLACQSVLLDAGTLRLSTSAVTLLQ